MSIRWSVGSRWQRWDPHLHAPGTLRNDQFDGDWDRYIRQIEEAAPPVVALGITDYFSVRTYKEVLQRKRAGALKNIALIFPNIEIRLTIETRERQGINLHLLVSPEQPDHLAMIEEKLAGLYFSYANDRYPCSEDGLRRLGRAHRGDATLPAEAALIEGVSQFKVEWGQILNLRDGDPWFRAHVLIAIAAGNDGLAGLARDASFHALREELGRRAHVIFSANPQDRTYWLGRHPDFLANKQTPKPCLHGSDAHALDTLLAPHGDRRCWIRAEPTFEGLRQTLVEPDRRVHIGDAAPDGPSPSNVIRSFRVPGAAWLRNQELLLNDGLVTIIGAKGSGKTALAELLAVAAGAVETNVGDASFIKKAGDLLLGAVAEIVWADDAHQSAPLPPDVDPDIEPRVRYLSQHFVEGLCTAHGLAQPLVDEIEGVVFAAIPEESRFECSSFGELRQFVLQDPSAERDARRDSIRATTRLIADEIRTERLVPSLKAAVGEFERERQGLEKQVAAIPQKLDAAKAKAQQDAAARLKALKDAIAQDERRARLLHDLAAELQRQERALDASMLSIRARYDALLTPNEWEKLRFRLDDDALPTLDRLERATLERATRIRERGLPLPVGQQTGAQVPDAGLALLEAETERLTKELGLDEDKAKRRVELEKRLVTVKQNEEKARRELDSAEKAPIRCKALQSVRLTDYEAVMVALTSEEAALRKLYDPLRHRLAREARLSKLAFVVERLVDVNEWADRGEALLDLRKPPFVGKGELARVARDTLREAWTRGTPQQARAAMEQFIEDYAVAAARDALANGVTLMQFGEWLFSTEHIAVRYGIQYENVDVVHLSPGTRGVVLLTLYLALDEWDHRPLIIDQPEENLDPGSVNSDLVPFFRDAARRRQIIMVTHNANLVVNGDSDQVIVAEAERTSPTDLPQITYHAGALEDREIRGDVCRLLEGGEEAFRKRGLRYNLP